MRFDNAIEELAATPSYVFVCFLLLILIFHLLFVWPRNLSAVAWKRVDYYWLLTLAVGLLSSSAAANRLLSERYLWSAAIRAEAAYEFLCDYLKLTSGPDSWLALPMVRSEHSPPYFDEFEAARRDLQAKVRAVLERLPDKVDAPFPSLKSLGFRLPPAYPPSEYAPSLNSHLSDIQQMAANYESLRKKANALQISSRTSTIEEIITLFGPILVALALALRITKVTGEVMIEKRKRDNAS